MCRNKWRSGRNGDGGGGVTERMNGEMNEVEDLGPNWRGEWKRGV